METVTGCQSIIPFLASDLRHIFRRGLTCFHPSKQASFSGLGKLACSPPFVVSCYQLSVSVTFLKEHKIEKVMKVDFMAVLSWQASEWQSSVPHTKRNVNVIHVPSIHKSPNRFCSMMIHAISHCISERFTTKHRLIENWRARPEWFFFMLSWYTY